MDARLHAGVRWLKNPLWSYLPKFATDCRPPCLSRSPRHWVFQRARWLRNWVLPGAPSHIVLSHHRKGCEEKQRQCWKLAHHVTEMDAQRVRHDVDIELTNVEGLDREFSKIGPGHTSSTKGFEVCFCPPGRVDYADASGVIEVGTELFHRPLRWVIYRDSRGLRGLDSSRVNEILNNIVRAMTFLGQPAVASY
jgi:hypothetical protein